MDDKLLDELDTGRAPGACPHCGLIGNTRCLTRCAAMIVRLVSIRIATGAMSDASDNSNFLQCMLMLREHARFLDEFADRERAARR